MRVRSNSHIGGQLLAAAALLAACDYTAPSTESVAGTYVATTFARVADGSVADQLAAGATLNMVLTPEGSTTGQLLIPAGNDDGSDLVASLAGTWILSGRIVAFDQSVETFVRDMPFTASGDMLLGDRTFGETRIRVILTKQ